MTRLGFILIFALMSLFGVLMIINYQNTYKLLPLNTPVAEKIDQYQFEDWKEYTSPDNIFSVLLPTLPQSAVDHVKDPLTQEVRKYDMHVSEKSDGTLFMITLITFSKMDESPESILKMMMNDVLKSDKNYELVSEQFTDYKGFKALVYSYKNEKFIFDVTSFVKDKTLYVLYRVTEKDRHNMVEYNYFVNSFHINKTT